MKRSDINQILRNADALLKSSSLALPPFAYWQPDQILSPQGDLIRARGLGWDITDYGEGRFDEMGLFLFTLRNGAVEDLQHGRGMLYAEKLLISRLNQLSPMHRHLLKAEDIINKAGGDLIIQLYASDPDGGIDRSSDITVLSDAVPQTLPAGGHLRLRPGQSVTLMPGDWHAFWAEGSDCVIGEVSTVNDDKTDNVFEAPIKRFSTVTEDEPPLYALVSDYPDPASSNP